MRLITKIKLLVILTLLSTLNLSAQTRWSKQYYEGVDAIGKNLSVAYDDGFLIVGKFGHNSVNYNWLIKTDINGEVLWEKTFGDVSTNIMIANLSCNPYGDLYLVGLTGFYNQQDYDPMIIKLNACGEKEWCKVFIEEGINYSDGLSVTPDGGVVMLLNQMSSIPFKDDICLAKFDINGDLLWRYCYNSSDTAVYGSNANDLILTSDGGFLISGLCDYQDPNNPTIVWTKPYYIKVDSIGEFEWETAVHSDVSDIGGAAWSTVSCPDNRFYYSSISHYYHPPYGDAPALLKMDLNGNIIDIYNLAPIGNYGKMAEAKFITDTTLMASAAWGNGPPKAVVIDTVGNTIHQSIILDNDWMANTEVTNDKKLMFFTNKIDEFDNFDAYLFKLNQQLESDTNYNQFFTYDSLCPYQIASDTIVQDGCGLIVGMEEIYAGDKDKELELLIYPNPARTYISISNAAGGIIDEITIYNQLGQRVLHKVHISDKIDVSMLEEGMFIIEFGIEDSRIRKKLIIQ